MNLGRPEDEDLPPCLMWSPDINTDQPDNDGLKMEVYSLYWLSHYTLQGESGWQDESLCQADVEQL